MLDRATRVAIILDLLKDGVVSNEAQYAGVDKASDALVARLASAVSSGPLQRNFSPARKVEHLLDSIRGYLGGMLRESQVKESLAAATAAAEQTAMDTVRNDLG